MKKVLILFVVISSVAWALSAQAAYLSTSGGGLYQYDIRQGTTTYVGRTGRSMTDIAMASNRLYGITFSAFYSIDVNTGHSSLIRNVGWLGLNALVGSPTGDTLYTASYRGSFGRLSDTGQYSLIGSLGKYKGRWLRSSGDLAFSADGTLYATVSNGRRDYLATIDVDTGRATVLGAIGYSAVYGLVFLDGTLYGTTASKNLIEINQATGQGTRVAKIKDIKLGAIWGATGGPSGATPEPATLLLLSSAMGMILWRRRRAVA